MKKLFLEQFTCINDNDGDDSDSPYFMFFVGRRSSPASADVQPIYLLSLDDKVAKSPFPIVVHKEVTAGVDHNSIVLIALLERDDGIDIDAQSLNDVRTWMKNKFTHHINGGQFPTDNQLANKMKAEFITVLNNNLGNDDMIGTKHVSIPSSGQPAVFHLHDAPDTGNYLVKLRLQ